jgi:hypothetical protein
MSAIIEATQTRPGGLRRAARGRPRGKAFPRRRWVSSEWVVGSRCRFRPSGHGQLVRLSTRDYPGLRGEGSIPVPLPLPSTTNVSH